MAQPITTVTAREFVHNVSASKRVASEGGTVIITDRGEPALALIPIAEYRRLTKTDRNPVELLRQNEAAYGNWRLSRGKQTETVKVHGKLSTNDGEVALNWALDGQGILMRAEWDIERYLRSGRLVQVLADHATAPADIHSGKERRSLQ